MKEVTPYEKLAYIYDHLMDHVDYTRWAEYIIKIINHIDTKIDCLIDLSCGTGSLIYQLKNVVKNVWGCDQSHMMVIQASKKLSPFSLFTNDIRNMAIRNNTLECVLLLYDSLNYMICEQDLKNALKEINRIIKPGGIFIFDVVSEIHCWSYYNDFHESEYWNGCGYTRHSYFDNESKLQYNNFRIVLNGKTFLERHIQKIYSIKFLIDILNKHSFEIINIFDEFSFEEANENSGRLHFICIKKK